MQAAKLSAPDAAPGGCSFGCSLAIDNNGIAVGTGYVFAESAGDWVQKSQLEINGSRIAGVELDILEYRILAGDVTGDGGEDGSGLAYVFHRLGSRWVRVATLAAGDGSSLDAFGRSVAIDGNRALIGACSSDDAGSQSGSASYFGLPLPSEIDIRPSSVDNRINPRSRGLVLVAILTTSVSDGDSVDFDAWDLDPTTITFGPEAAQLAHTSSHPADVDGGGDIDMLAHFRMSETSLVCGNDSAILSGEIEGGERVYGLDSLLTVGCHGR